MDALIAEWCDLRGKADLPLVVACTSSEDLVQNQGYEQFIGRPNTTLVPKTLPELKKFYGVDAAWPGGLGKFDLGGRVLTVIPTPGTHIDGITFYDPYNQFLYTGDFLFPGRILISNEKDYAASIKRLKGIAERFPLKWVMGGQIEMTIFLCRGGRIIRAGLTAVEHGNRARRASSSRPRISRRR